MRHAASKAAGFDHILRVSVAFPSGACCTSVRLTVAPERRPKKEANPASLRSAAPSKGRGLRGYSLLPMEGGAPKGRRLDEDSGMKKSEEMHLKQAINESTLSTADAVPLPQWGRLRYESTAILISSERIHACVEKQYGRTKPSPRGEGAPKGRMVKPLPQP